MTPAPPFPPLRLLVLGASGRIGRALQLAWALQTNFSPIWQHRSRTGETSPEELNWDILRQPPPETGPLDAVLMLAGSARGDDAALQVHRDLALAGLAAARRAGARHFFAASSAAVYGGGPLRREIDPAAPRTDYAKAKLAMENALWQARRPDHTGITCLRIGNVAGADALLTNAAKGAVQIDRTAPERGPLRSWIGPETLAHLLARLVRLAAKEARPPLPFHLNVAQPGPVAMQELAEAYGADWRWREPAHGALDQLTLDTARLASLLPVLAADPTQLVAEARRVYGENAPDQSVSQLGAAP